MLREANQITERTLRRSSRRQASTLRATCLLCRVLWPIVVQHRHLVDRSSEDSSEAKTILLPRTSSLARTHTSGCSDHSPV